MLAARGGDDGLEFWFWLVVGIAFIIKKVIDFLKAKGADQEEETMVETEDHHEKRVKEVIADMRRTVTPPPQPQRQAQPPMPQPAARAPRQAPSPVELPNPSVPRRRQPQPTPAPVPDWGSRAQDAAKNTLDRYVKATEEARQSLNSLSDAEQAALQSLQRQQAPVIRQEQVSAAHVPGLTSLKDSLRHSQSLRAAILYQEILGSPKALRSFQQ